MRLIIIIFISTLFCQYLQAMELELLVELTEEDAILKELKKKLIIEEMNENDAQYLTKILRKIPPENIKN